LRHARRVPILALTASSVPSVSSGSFVEKVKKDTALKNRQKGNHPVNKSYPPPGA